jgi:hypothetical protein
MRALRAADGAVFGPQTCGCVAVIRHMARYGAGSALPAAGWSLCPHCGGAGVDPRPRRGRRLCAGPDCGEVIAAKILRADPTATLCGICRVALARTPAGARW